MIFENDAATRLRPHPKLNCLVRTQGFLTLHFLEYTFHTKEDREKNKSVNLDPKVYKLCKSS